jgi:phosphatidylglycerol---prolipoprotein diacylglyceryl transferase
VRYPDGARHDLGLYELLFTIVLAVFLFLYNRKPRPPGRIIGIAALAYAPVRFGLDFLRATDVSRPDQRYFGLTPAQWACIATAGLAIYLLRRSMHQPPSTPSRPLPAQSGPHSDAALPPDHTPPETPSNS